MPYENLEGAGLWLVWIALEQYWLSCLYYPWPAHTEGKVQSVVDLDCVWFDLLFLLLFLHSVHTWSWGPSPSGATQWVTLMGERSTCKTLETHANQQMKPHPLSALLIKWDCKINPSINKDFYIVFRPTFMKLLLTDSSFIWWAWSLFEILRRGWWNWHLKKWRTCPPCFPRIIANA